MAKSKRFKNVFYRTNWQIRAPKVRLINQEGKQIGVFSLTDARQKAREESLDLVEVAPRANPPVIKLIDFNKFKYQEAKKQKEERKKQGEGIKEIWATPFIEKQDLEVRLKKIEKFLKKGYRVRLVVKFLGRQITQKSYGHELIDQIAQKIADFGKAEDKPKLRGKRLIVLFKAEKRNEKQKTENKKIGGTTISDH